MPTPRRRQHWSRRARSGVRPASRGEVDSVFRAAPEMYLYGIGDLSDFFWDRATWWATPRAAIGLLRLDGIPDPILYAQGPPDDPELLALAAAVVDHLPSVCEGQVAIGIDRALSPWFDVALSIPLRGMILTRPDALVGDGIGDRLGIADYPEIRAFFDATADAEGHLGPDMVAAGQYFGVRDASGTLVAVAGVHLAVPSHGVAAIANVATHPDHRGRGLARGLVTRLARELHAAYPVVGLSCRMDNAAALRLYASLGFEVCHAFVHQRFVRRA